MHLTQICWTVGTDENDEQTCPMHVTDYGNTFFFSPQPRVFEFWRSDDNKNLATFYLFPTDEPEVHFFFDEPDRPPFTYFVGIPSHWKHLVVTYLQEVMATIGEPSNLRFHRTVLVLHHKVVAPSHLWQMNLDLIDERENQPGDPFFIEIEHI